MRHKFPEGYTKAIKYQMQLLTSSMVIVLQYMHPDMMFHVDEFIKAIDGVIDIMPDKTAVTTGKYRVQVTQEKFKKARDFLIECLPGWCQEYIPDDAYPHPNPFPEPPKVKPIHNDGFSSGENSWMSQSNTSFMSMDLSNIADDDYFTNTTSATKAFTYAEIVLPKHTIHYQAQHQDLTTQPRESHAQKDDDTRAAISDITTTVKTPDNETALQELENAKEIIERQRREIEELRKEHQKSLQSYENVMTHLNERLLEQEAEASAMKHEISTMIQTQQQNHSDEMQELYDRMMQQMASMLHTTIPNPPQSPTMQQHSIIAISNIGSEPEQTFTNSPNANQHPGKKQDTRPSPTKRKQNSNQKSPTPLNDDLTKIAHEDHTQSPMEVDADRSNNPIQENDV
jgi:hypothetical protein